MNILIDLLPEEVTIDGVNYKINSDFRTSMLFEMMMQDNEIDESDKLIRTIDLYYPVIPENIEQAIEKALWFYRCGKSIQNGKRDNNGKSEQIYSFEYDDEYIYSAFLDQYGFDLQDTQNLHWWKFKAMFKSLKEDNEIVKIMGYRAMTISNNMSKEQKDFYRSMKRLHEIPKSKSEQEKINDIEKALLGDGDLTKIL
ncbi:MULTISPECIES: bacteriophage Gp15 family protein [Clostridium]|uniref:Bacteriophage Gp15 family protein n=1 Tax=Clostridium cibarium TaxID=2762247 RepID=A0ABR8PV27_9CLOT|nr:MULTISPECIES: bacteriophage Gp15 family protein [Clostridium]MBD7912014.1 bacteriophage Gp15 family protein [Clostridium cibarium]